MLDIAAGTGNVAIPAALAGARVIASDLTPELLEEGPLTHGSGAPCSSGRSPTPSTCRTTTASSTWPSPPSASCSRRTTRPAADELVRVVAPGGRIGLVSWTPAGFIGQMFATMKPFVAPPPAGVQPPPLWGDQAHVRELLGDRVTDVRVEHRTVRVTDFAEPADFREYFKTNYGPTIAAYKQQPDAAEGGRAGRRPGRARRAVRRGCRRAPGPGVGVPAADLSPRLSHPPLRVSDRRWPWARMGR